MVSKLIEEYFKIAEDKLDSARILLEHEKYDDAVSRAYYAVFHCIQALLFSIGVKTETHAGARNLFGIHFIKTGLLDKKFAKYLKELKEEREMGDYGLVSSIEEDEAASSIKEAEEFLVETQKYLYSRR